MHSGPKTTTNGLVMCVDATSRRSTLQSTQTNNILPNSLNWTLGQGSVTGYSANGSSTEQLRVKVSTDPWGRTQTVWRTTPDSTSGADGGWNSSYYTIDDSVTYRYSVWVRRHTEGTGGTFYHGMSPNPLRNDNNANQGNPYFIYTAISNLTYNQWYLVVSHVFPHFYNDGDRHAESGWYENGLKITDKSFGNCGDKDVRWVENTTSARSRAYHYYTTNVNSGIEFCNPRIDKIDGNEPSISELINSGESGWKNLVGTNNIGEVLNGTTYTQDGVKSSWTFDGTDDYINLGSSTPLNIARSMSVFAVAKFDSLSGWSGIFGNSAGSAFCHFQLSGGTINVYLYGPAIPCVSSSIVSTNQWTVLGFTFDGTTLIIYKDGVEVKRATTSSTANITGCTDMGIGKVYSSDRYSDGMIPVVKVHNRACTQTEITNDFNVYKKRFNI